MTVKVIKNFFSTDSKLNCKTNIQNLSVDCVLAFFPLKLKCFAKNKKKKIYLLNSIESNIDRSNIKIEVNLI